MKAEPALQLPSDLYGKHWLVRVDGEVVGPVSLQQLSKGHTAGTLPEDAELAHVDRRQWWCLEPAFWQRLATECQRRSGVRPRVEAPSVPAPTPVVADHAAPPSWEGHTLCGPMPRPAPIAPPPDTLRHPPVGSPTPIPAEAELPEFEEEPVEIPTCSLLRAIFG